MPKVNIDFQVEVEKEEFKDICRKVLAKIPNYTLNESGDSFLVNENKTDLLNGTYAVKADVQYHNGTVTIFAKCAGIGPVQKKHVTEAANIIKGVIERGIAEKDEKNGVNDGMVRCPKCGSTQIQLSKRGWTITTGLIGSGRNERVCMQCMYKF